MSATDTAVRHGLINEAKLAALLNDASIDQTLALDTSLHIIAWNKACEEITGLPRTTAIGKTFIDVHPKAADFPAVMEGIINGMKGFKSFASWEASAYAPGYFEHHFVPLKAEDDDVVGVLIIIHDVAHRIKAEQDLQRLNRQLAQKAKELQEKSEELTRFNWIASHDLKEPLRKIYTFIEMVATKEGIKLTDAARTNLRRAQSAAQRMGLLTDDIVTFTQVAAPNETLDDVDLEQVFAVVLSNNRRTIENDGAVVECSPLPVVRGYRNLLNLLMGHLLSNALKFHAEGAQPKVRVSYALVAGTALSGGNVEADASYHRLGFEDNGIGIAQEYFEQIFGMFQRLHPQGAYRGTGMGLAICRKIAAAHEGFITVDSTEGQGSTFCCYLKAEL